MTVIVPSHVKSMELDMVITRANGTVEHVPGAAYFNRNPIKMGWWKTKNFIRKVF